MAEGPPPEWTMDILLELHSELGTSGRLLFCACVLNASRSAAARVPAEAADSRRSRIEFQRANYKRAGTVPVPEDVQEQQFHCPEPQPPVQGDQ